MKIYFFSRPLEASKYSAYVNKKIRHTGFIVDDPKQGLVQIELKGDIINAYKAEKVTEFHWETKSKKSPWALLAGETTLSYQDIIAEADAWIKRHIHYTPTQQNCRKFTSDLLIHCLKKHGTINTVVSEKDFDNSPCEAFEKKARHDKFNTPHHIKSEFENNAGVKLSKGPGSAVFFMEKKIAGASAQSRCPEGSPAAKL